MSTSSNSSISTYSPSDPETPQRTNKKRKKNFNQSLSHADLNDSIEQSHSGSAQNEMHQKRMQALRNELDYLKSTEWKFERDKGFLQ